MRIYVLDLLPTVPYYTGHLCAALKDTPGIDLRMAATTYSHDREFFRKAGVIPSRGLVDVVGKLSLARPIRRLGKAVEYLLNLFSLTLRFIARRPDLLHVQFSTMAERGLPIELWFLAIVRRLGIKIVYTVHNVVPHNSGENIKHLYSRLYGLVDVFICHDRFTKQELVNQFAIDAEKVAVIPHGVLFGDAETKANCSCREELGIPPNDTVVLWQGIISRYKGIPFLLRTWAEVQRRGIRGSLWIIGTGDGQLVDEIRSQVETLALTDSVKLDFRFVPMQELEGLYEAADIVVFPYKEISTSGALMTAVRFGKAILASGLPGFKNVLENERNALLVPYGETELWAEAILRLVEDRLLREQLGAAVRATQNAVPSWREIATQTAAIYEQVLLRKAASFNLSMIH